ncbi:chitinase, partial [Planosporangium thailandense]|nr:chitinase [Planosporangium thailandense]
MRRPVRPALAVLAATAAVAGISIAATSASADTETVTNAGFEAGLTGWSCTAAAGVVAGHAHSGAQALQGTPAGNDNAQCSQTVAVAPNT